MSIDAQAGKWVELNRANWDERVPIHVTSEFYDLDGFVSGAEALRDFEPDEVGDVRGKRLLHLQCHIGTDTLAWARRGASVTGVDFSEPAVRTATDLAVRIGITGARFVTANVYDAVTALDRDRYDIVYTGVGALVWLPDLVRWASVVAELLTPGGFVYLTEFHPFGDILAEDDGRTVAYDYFDPAPQVFDEPGTYTDPDAATTANMTVQWQHGIGDIISALAGAGLRLEFLHEHDFTLYPRFRNLVADGGRYRLPPGQPRVPLLFSLRASKPDDC